MIKFRFYYDKDKEEQFLNSMSERGYAMKKFILGFHIFEKTEPNKYTYRVDLISNKKMKELHDYILLIEETGAEYVQRWGMWVYFRKKGNFELYTDIDSQIDLYQRIRATFGYMTVVELGCLIMEINAMNYSKIAFYFFVFILIIILALTYQIYKCTKKINYLKIKK